MESVCKLVVSSVSEVAENRLVENSGCLFGDRSCCWTLFRAQSDMSTLRPILRVEMQHGQAAVLWTLPARIQALAAKPRMAASEEKKHGRVWSELQLLRKITL